jgi:DNA repair protein RadC
MGAVSELSREIVKNALNYRASTAVLVRHCDGRTLQPTAEELETLEALRESLSYVDVRLADYVRVSGERILRVARAFPEYVFFDPDVALTFRVPKGSEPAEHEADVSLLSELLAYAGIRDTSEVDALLRRHGSIGTLLSTPAPELIRAGLSERAAVLLTLVLSIYARGEVAALSDTASLDSAERQADYFARHYVGVRDERLSLLLLDAKSRPIAFVPFGDGGVGNTTVDLRKIVELALFHRACSVALAHNHPGGTLTPSPEDVLATRSVEGALLGVGVTLDEHYVLVGRAFTAIRLYSEELLTVRPPSFYGDASFREIHRCRADVYRPCRRIGLRET